MSCRFQVFANSVTSARTADSSSALNTVGVSVMTESRKVNLKRTITPTASIAKTVRFMNNSSIGCRYETRPDCTRTPHRSIVEKWDHVQDDSEWRRGQIVRTRHFADCHSCRRRFSVAKNVWNSGTPSRCARKLEGDSPVKARQSCTKCI